MRKAYVRELKAYSLAALAAEFGMSNVDTRDVIMELMVRGIVRYRTDKASDEEDMFDGEDAKDDERYKFNFVGLLMFGDLVLLVYPKYFRDREPRNDELVQIFRVIKRNAGWATVPALSDDGDQTDDKLPVMLALLELYSDYGVYSNCTEGRELNGSGPIDWNRTIAAHQPVLTDGRPVYIEYETRKTLCDESDFITRLHRAVLTECSRKLFDAQVGDLLSLAELELSGESVDEFGDVEFLEWRLEHERRSQFIDWKDAVLDLLSRYLLNRKSSVECDKIRSLGTTSFFSDWELACKAAFGDALKTELGNLGFELRGEWKERNQDRLISIIESPEWERPQGGGYIKCDPVRTFRPDIVSFPVDAGGCRVFSIYDAKYCVPNVEGAIKGQPGLYSVTKQFLYQAAYKKFVIAHGFERVVNAFLVPTDEIELRELARVSFPEVMGKTDRPLSDYIHMWALPASDVFDAYLRGERIDMGAMRAVWESGKG